MEGTAVAELEGFLLKNRDPFPYFMLTAFEASGLIRFTALLSLWPVICLLRIAGLGAAGLRVMVFVSTAGIRASEIEAVARAVLPKFYMDDVDMDAWDAAFGVQGGGRQRVVVTACPRVMAERFATYHLRADEVVGPELAVNRFGYATGLIVTGGGRKPTLPGGGPVVSQSKDGGRSEFLRPRPVIFHDGRLVGRPTAWNALGVVLWIPFGIVLSLVRIVLGAILPIFLVRRLIRPFGGAINVRGHPPPSASPGVLFVATHRSLLDPVVLALALGRRVRATTYSISPLAEILSPIPTVRLTRDRAVDAARIREELTRGDLVVCPEGTTCREPFLLRFSALFAELTDSIVPVAMNYRVGVFHATTARGWKAMDPLFFFMNPRPVYEVTFLGQLPPEATCAAGRTPYDVANHVQRILATELEFECTNFTRRDKYRVLAGSDGTVAVKPPAMQRVKWALGFFLSCCCTNLSMVTRF